MKPVLLALSTFRQSDAVIRKAIELAKNEDRRLIVAFVVDVNLARYLIGSDVMPGSDLEQRCKAELLEQHRAQAEASVTSIAAQAAKSRVECDTSIVTGRFGVEILRVIREHQPEKVMLTRSRRPKWVLQLFGSPVDYIIEHAGCPVSEDG